MPGIRPRGALHGLYVRAAAVPKRKLFLLVTGIFLLSFTSLLFLSSSTPLVSSLDELKAALPDSIPNVNLPDVRLPKIISGQPVHEPLPAPADGTVSSDNAWFGSLKWLVEPFHSYFSKESGIALPPLEERCTMYTYHDKKTGEEGEVEERILRAWRRAWWAYGFNPIIITKAEAKTHKKYLEVLAGDNINPDLRRDMEGMLAWHAMNAGAGERGIFMDHRIFPMAPRDDDTISYLRSCRFSGVTGYRDFGARVLAADKAGIRKLTRLFEASRFKKDSKSLMDALNGAEEKPEDYVQLRAAPTSLAEYSTEKVKELYPKLKLADLPSLINAHLHQRFHSQFSSGIGILSPMEKDLSPLYAEAVELATKLAVCPRTPLKDSCPPNIPKCVPCTTKLSISEPPAFQNSSQSFTLGLIPHPYTTLSLTTFDINLAKDPHEHLVKYIRRKSPRDAYIRAVTDGLINHGIGTAPRLQALKDAVAARGGRRVVSMWGTDVDGFRDVEWSLGFRLPAKVGFDKKRLQMTGVSRLMAAKEALHKGKERVIGVIESWNLADREIWGFVRAWEGRKVESRRKWSREEKRYGQGVSEDEL